MIEHTARDAPPFGGPDKGHSTGKEKQEKRTKKLKEGGEEVE